MSRTLWIDYLRSFITVLVIAHHSSLAYTTFASFNKTAYITSTNPIVDSQRWVGLDIFENFNDVFFMSLMFFIAGLFLFKSIQKKGALAFSRDRVYRLLIPFLLGGTLLNLLAYFPAYKVAHDSNDIAAYVKDFFFVEQWPVGPPWFIWVLFVFNIVFALIYSLRKKWQSSELLFNVDWGKKPLGFILGWFLFTFILYVPFAFWLGVSNWTGFGPFDFQLNRALMYFGYFILGTAIGNTSFNDSIFNPTSSLVRNWKWWVFLSALTYTILTIFPATLTKMVKQNQLSELVAYLIYFSIYVASCTLSCIAFITMFRATVSTPKKWWNSLSDNAYLIYLVHYVFIVWSQYLLLEAPFPAFVKFLITFVVSVSASWAVSILIRKNAFLRRYL
ncbi:acyltransferase [Dyadobacter pollutisoli]|uniref:Acyltransferase n=1 Tax=Dyadobacter pollutisoli TaxID=2910158 RepID=A0A9E8SIP4_9BACT|nr:acyltransferase [Dyadobacter pollutisoli]WAC09344.1 acyltransferase [Dyadobacter pollutisoli]